LHIAGTVIEKEYKEWKAKHIPQYENKNEEEGSRARLGQGYWQGFMCQHAHILQTKKVVLFDSQHDDWTNPCTFEKIYSEVQENESIWNCGKKG